MPTSMPARFVNLDRDTPLLLPPDLRDWVPQNHLAHFILDALTGLPFDHVPRQRARHGR